MNPELKDALAAYLIALADDELILGHRDSEWCGHAPILEEDIAFANIALDEIGHARIWYELAADLLGKDRETYPDELVYRRDASAFRCSQFVEQPKGDWAFSMLRQYLFDAFEKMRLDVLVNSTYQPIAEAAAKIRAEEIYHLRHTSAWVRRLGLGTEESNRRMQRALDELLPHCIELYDASIGGKDLLFEAGYVPEPSSLWRNWNNAVISYLSESDLTIDRDFPLLPMSRVHHSVYLAPLVQDLQQVARAYPDAKW
jgi:ring-1,2-phenylacetyl-CoA epoxidase subunit PaaC